MFVMMTKEQFEILKQKANTGSRDSEGEKLPKLTLKAEDEVRGTINTDDVLVDYFYNVSEGRLNFSVSKRHTLAAYCASDNIIGTFLMDILSAIPNPAPKPKESGDGAKQHDGGSEGTEKKDQPEPQPANL